MEHEVKCIEYAKHAIGLDNKKPYKRHGRLFYRPYRNYFCASGKQIVVWEVLRKKGYADRGMKSRTGIITYWLTREGLDWLGEKLGIKIYDEED